MICGFTLTEIILSNVYAPCMKVAIYLSSLYAAMGKIYFLLLKLL